MAERKGPRTKTKAEPVAAVTAPSRDDDESERSLGRMVALGLPVACLGGALAAGVMAGVGSAIMVLAAGALVGTIALLWASLRTLSGDAPLTLDLEALAARRLGVDSLAEQKRRVLRSLKDLESEHALGKIDDADYRSFVSRYRDEAKVVMRRMDLEVEPKRKEAERVAQDYLRRQGLATGEAEPTEEPPTPERSEQRLACAACKTSNEVDATFCKKCGARLAKEAESPDATA